MLLLRPVALGDSVGRSRELQQIPPIQREEVKTLMPLAGLLLRARMSQPSL